MLSQVIQSVTFFVALLKLDLLISEKCRGGKCPYCGGPLHRAYFLRKGVGAASLAAGGAKEAMRYGLCCGHCRQRLLPASAAFLGRKVYVAAAVLLATREIQNRLDPESVRVLQSLLGVSVKTLKRWVAFFKDGFPRGRQWQDVRGFLGPDVRDCDLPDGLLRYFWRVCGDGLDGLRACLCFLATGRVEVQHLPCVALAKQGE